jgi:hypothetical protein
VIFKDLEETTTKTEVGFQEEISSHKVIVATELDIKLIHTSKTLPII